MGKILRDGKGNAILDKNGHRQCEEGFETEIDISEFGLLNNIGKYTRIYNMEQNPPQCERTYLPIELHKSNIKPNSTVGEWINGWKTIFNKLMDYYEEKYKSEINKCENDEDNKNSSNNSNNTQTGENIIIKPGNDEGIPQFPPNPKEDLDEFVEQEDNPEDDMDNITSPLNQIIVSTLNDEIN